MFGISLPSNTHTSLPSGLRMFFGALSRHFAGTWLSNMSGGSTTWSSTLTRIMSSTRIGAPRQPFVHTDASDDRRVDGVWKASSQRLTNGRLIGDRAAGGSALQPPWYRAANRLILDNARAPLPRHVPGGPMRLRPLRLALHVAAAPPLAASGVLLTGSPGSAEDDAARPDSFGGIAAASAFHFVADRNPQPTPVSDAFHA